MTCVRAPFGSVYLCAFLVTQQSVLVQLAKGDSTYLAVDPTILAPLSGQGLTPLEVADTFVGFAEVQQS